MGKGGAPAPDPKIGEAAMMSARTGQDYLAMMREQAAITNEWAAQDRNRYRDKFIPLEDQYIADAQQWASPGRSAMEADRAGATARNQLQLATDSSNRQMLAMGVNPASGRGIEGVTRGQTAVALGEVGARNTARMNVQQQGMNLRASVLNMGKGLEVNPGTSMGLSNNAYGAGFQGAMGGYRQQGDLLNTQFQQQMQQYQAKQQAGSSFWGGIGTLAGAFFSDEDKKKNKAKPKRSPREAIDKMRVEEWDYKKGVADEGRHIGTYAQDFQKQTGIGDGRSIMVQDAIGVTMGAVKEVSQDVRKLTKELAAMKAMAGGGSPRARSI